MKTLITLIIGLLFMVGSGFIGLRRLTLISIIFIAGFLSFAAYRGFHSPIAHAVAILGIEPVNAFFISLFIVILVPLFISIYIGVKIVNLLGIIDYISEYGSVNVSVVDKIFGSGFGLLIYLILYSIIVRIL